MPAELNPCPFCGNTPTLRIPEPTDGFAIHVRCRCGVEMYGAKSHFTDADSATSAWNCRAAARKSAGAANE